MAMIPAISLKLAMSLDGKIATRTGESKWITGPASRSRVMQIRAEQDAILTGVNTVIADNPTFSVKDQNGKTDPSHHQRRVILDTHGRSPQNSLVFQNCDQNPTTVIGGPDFSRDLRSFFESVGVEFIESPLKGGRVDILPTMNLLYKRGVRKLLVESGGEVAASFIEGEFISQVFFFYGPIIIGGKDAIPGVGGLGASNLEKIHKILDWKVVQLGQDLLLSGSLKKVDS